MSLRAKMELAARIIELVEEYEEAAKPKPRPRKKKPKPEEVPGSE